MEGSKRFSTFRTVAAGSLMGYLVVVLYRFSFTVVIVMLCSCLWSKLADKRFTCMLFVCALKVVHSLSKTELDIYFVRNWNIVNSWQKILKIWKSRRNCTGMNLTRLVYSFAWSGDSQVVKSRKYQKDINLQEMCQASTNQ